MFSIKERIYETEFYVYSNKDFSTVSNNIIISEINFISLMNEIKNDMTRKINTYKLEYVPFYMLHEVYDENIKLMNKIFKEAHNEIRFRISNEKFIFMCKIENMDKYYQIYLYVIDNNSEIYLCIGKIYHNSNSLDKDLNIVNFRKHLFVKSSNEEKSVKISRNNYITNQIDDLICNIMNMGLKKVLMHYLNEECVILGYPDFTDKEKDLFTYLEKIEKLKDRVLIGENKKNYDYKTPLL